MSSSDVRPSELGFFHKCYDVLTVTPGTSIVTGGVKSFYHLLATSFYGAETVVSTPVSILPLGKRRVSVVNFRNSCASLTADSFKKFVLDLNEMIPVTGNYSTHRIRTLENEKRELLAAIEQLKQAEPRVYSSEEEKKLVSDLEDKIQTLTAEKEATELKVSDLENSIQGLNAEKSSEAESTAEELRLEREKNDDLVQKYETLLKTTTESHASKDALLASVSSVIPEILRRTEETPSTVPSVPALSSN